MHSLVQAIKLKEIPPKLLCLVSLSSNDKNIKISKKRRCRGGRVGDFQVNKIKILIGKAPRLRPGGFLFYLDIKIFQLLVVLFFQCQRL